ncbi:glycosyltransferase [Saccharicrinis sp. FJH54]|uniref:glycosyltransferase n=1 Tax=Saccharicrinis sp. FJH54 TaxID=3344665 RepID=UPI0035D3ECAD
MNAAIGHILHIPRWFPGLNSPQGGIFIFKHIAASINFRHSVINVNSSRGKNIPVNTVLIGQTDLITTYSYFYNSRNKVWSLFLYVRGVYKCYKEVLKQQSKPDVIHAHVLLRTYVVAYFIHLLLKKPYIITEHWSGYHYGLFWKKSLFYRFLLRFTMKRAGRILVVSNRLKRDILDCVSVEQEQLEIIPNVAEAIIKKHQSKADGPVRIVSVADLKDGIKRVSSVIEIIRELNLENVEYHIIGDGPDMENLQVLAGSMLNRSVYFYGELSNDQVLSKLSEFDFLIQNSLYETFGLVPLEALLAGLPVISTITGCPEEIQSSEAGIFIDPDQPEALKNAIYKMVNTYRNYDLGGIQKKITERFSSAQVGIEQERIYNDILKK